MLPALTQGPGWIFEVSLLHLIVVAVVQGLTEFLPISSSAHLILIPVVTDWPDQGPTVDVAAHIGTLGAIILYLRRDVGVLMVRGDISRKLPNDFQMISRELPG